MKRALVALLLVLTGCQSVFETQLGLAAKRHPSGFALGEDYIVTHAPQAVIDLRHPGAGAYVYNGRGYARPFVIVWSDQVPFNRCLLDHELWHLTDDPKDPGWRRRHAIGTNIWDDTGHDAPCGEWRR